MSEYQSTTVVLEPTRSAEAVLADVLRELHGAPSEWVASGSIASVRSQLAAAASVAEARSVIDSQAVRCVGSGSPAALRQVVEVLDLANQDNGCRPPPAAIRSLDAALAKLETQSRVVERCAVARLASQSLRSIGYSIREASGGAVIGLDARRGHSVVAISVGDGGSLELDILGHGGDSCVGLVEECQQAFAAHGMRVRVVRRDRHGDPRGGSLIDRAAKANPLGDLAVGIVAAARSSTRTSSTPGDRDPRQRVRG